MNELIERLEAATGPDRELDAAIFAAVYPDKVPGPIVESGYGWRKDPGFWWLQTGEDDRTPRQTVTPLPFTASIDAALTLCGGESGLGSLIAGKFSDGTRGWVARVRSPETADGEGNTPALAICIAALRAHSTGMEGNGNG